MPQPYRRQQPFAIHEATALLARVPAMLDVLLRGLPDHWLSANEGENTWSPFDVVGHLIHGDKTDWLPRVRVILRDGDTRAFEPFDRVAQLARSDRPSIAELLDEFAAVRRRCLEELTALNLTESDLDRHGRHPELGTVTLRQLLATWVAHDFDHVMQIARVMGRQYADSVGPWRAYLRIISGQQG